MKKFLAILLIAIIACETVEQKELEEALKNVWDLLKKLKAEGKLDPIINALKTAGKIAAEALCCTYAPEFCGLCSALLSII